MYSHVMPRITMYCHVFPCIAMYSYVMPCRHWLLKMTSRPGFFNSGNTKASFQISGKHPHCNELLTIFVRTGRRSSHLLTSVDGIGSRGQDLRAEFWISCLTSRTDSIVKVGNGGKVSADEVSSSGYESVC